MFIDRTQAAQQNASCCQSSKTIAGSTSETSMVTLILMFIKIHGRSVTPFSHEVSEKFQSVLDSSNS
jgi:hypothetical protein